MNNIDIGRESIRITADRKYMVNGAEIDFSRVDVEQVIVISPKDGESLLEAGIDEYKTESMCEISVINSDSFEAGRKFDNALVMNFANAHNPGGGFLHGANAQEESLCRCSTLYASITTGKASEMYRYNNSRASRVESDYMLISPNVVVFRGEGLALIDNPYTLGVVTIPAPNKRGAALFAGDKLIEDTFVRRIRIMLCAAAKYGYKDLVLGAWGCGAFGNDPDDVAGYFRRVIVDEEYGKCFNNICFAVYGREDGRNITAFRKCFT